MHKSSFDILVEIITLSENLSFRCLPQLEDFLLKKVPKLGLGAHPLNGYNKSAPPRIKSTNFTVLQLSQLFLSDIRHNVSVTHNFFCYAQLFSVTHNFFCYAQLFLLRTPLRTTFSVTHNFFLLRTTFSVTHTVTHNFFSVTHNFFSVTHTVTHNFFSVTHTVTHNFFSVTHTVTHNFFCYAQLFFCYAHRYAQLFSVTHTVTHNFFLLRTPLRTTFSVTHTVTHNFY